MQQKHWKTWCRLLSRSIPSDSPEQTLASGHNEWIFTVKKGLITLCYVLKQVQANALKFFLTGAVNKPSSSSRQSFLFKSSVSKVLLQIPCFWVSWVENRLSFRAAYQLNYGCFLEVRKVTVGDLCVHVHTGDTIVVFCVFEEGNVTTVYCHVKPNKNLWKMTASGKFWWFFFL